MSILSCQIAKRANKCLVGALRAKNRLKHPPSSHSILHEHPLIPIKAYNGIPVSYTIERKPSVYQGVRRINCPLTHYFRGWGGV